MHPTNEFLKNLAMVLPVAAAASVLFQKLRQPVVLGYLLAGLVVGPHLPIPLFADVGMIHALSDLGVILLMFSIGLEFSFRKLLRVGPIAGIIAAVQVTVMIWLGYLTGRAFGWTAVESLYTGGIIAISSTTIIAKVFDEQKVGGALRELVFAVLLFEDLVAILMLVVFTGLAAGSGLSASMLAATGGKLALFLLVLMVVGMLVIPRLVRFIVGIGRPETTLVGCVGICFAIALLTQSMGYSVALGAFLAGSLVSESGEEIKIEHLVRPIRDLFAAVFFVSVGMLIDPKLVAENWAAVLVLTAVVVIGKLLGVGFGAFLTGSGVRRSVEAGMSLAQIGEFSFIIAGLGLQLGATRSFLYPVAVAVSAATTLLTPWLIRASGATARFVDRRLPAPLQTFAALYATWIQRLGASRKSAAGRPVRRRVLLLLADTVLLAGAVLADAWATRSHAGTVATRIHVSENTARLLLVVAALVVAAPFAMFILRGTRNLGNLLADQALPPASDGRVDLARAVRQNLVIGLQSIGLIVIALLLLALVQPFLPSWQGIVAICALFGMVAVAFWRSAQNLEGHVRAGAEVIVETLGAQSRSEPENNGLAIIEEALPGLGEPVGVKVEVGSAADGKCLIDLALRSDLGVTVLAIRRGESAIPMPSGRERLQGGDAVALAGTREAVEAATLLFRTGAAPADAHAPGSGAHSVTLDSTVESAIASQARRSS